MATAAISYATSTALTFTSLQSLASSASAGACSAVVDNSSNLYEDAMISVIIKVPNSGAVANDYCCYVYVYASEDGTTYSGEGEIDGTDQAVAAGTNSEKLMAFLGIVAVPAINDTFYKIFGSVALAFGGVMPRKWGIYIRNYSGATLDSSGNVVSYTGIKYTVA